MNRSALCGIGALLIGAGIVGSGLFANDENDRAPQRDSGRAVQRDTDARTDVKLSEELPATLARVSDVSGINVYAKDGKELGKIDELVIDLEGGCVEYAVLSVGGFLGVGDKYLAVPWPALVLNRTQDRDRHFVINIDASRLKTAPGFDKDKWPNFADRQFSSEVHKFYGVERRQMGFRPGDQRREGVRDQDRGQHRDRDHNRTETQPQNRGKNASATPERKSTEKKPAAPSNANSPAESNSGNNNKNP